MKKVLLFVNPKASQAEGSFESVAAHFKNEGYEVIKGTAKSPDDYFRAIRAHQNEIDLVAVGGGDGTLQSASEALIEVQIPLGIIPLGTANNVARSLGIPLEIQEAVQVATQGAMIHMDVARVNGRIFLSVVGMGLSTSVHDEVPDQHKKRWGWLSYAFYAFKMLIKRPPKFWAEILSEDININVKALQISVCNGRYYGAHVAVHPEATLRDSLLDVSIIESRYFLRGFLKALIPYAADHKEAGLKALRTKKVTIKTKPIIKIDVEGATDLRTPAEFEIQPEALKVRVKSAPTKE